MQAIVDKHGEAKEADGAPELSADVIAMARDICVLRMRRRGVPWRKIGAFLGTPQSTIRLRVSRLSPEVREYYLHTPLSSLGL
jgi:hypothetical protein